MEVWKWMPSTFISTKRPKQKKNDWKGINFKKANACQKSCQHRSYFQVSTVAFVFFAGRVSANLHAGVCVRSLGEDIVLVRNAVALGASCLEFFAWNKMQVQKPFMLWKKSWNHSKKHSKKDWALKSFQKVFWRSVVVAVGSGLFLGRRWASFFSYFCSTK